MPPDVLVQTAGRFEELLGKRSGYTGEGDLVPVNLKASPLTILCDRSTLDHLPAVPAKEGRSIPSGKVAVVFSLSQLRLFAQFLQSKGVEAGEGLHWLQVLRIGYGKYHTEYDNKSE